MSQEKYNLIHHKDFHNLQLQNYSVKERAVFLTLCLKVMEQEDDVVVFDIAELAKISNYAPRKKGDNIILFLKELNDKLKTMEVMQIKENGGFKSIILFPTFEVNPTSGKVKIRVNPDYKYLLNHLKAPYTIQALIEYSELKSGYSQLMYSLLKCWNKAKRLKISLEDFRSELGVPEGYSISVIDKRVLAPIMKELPKIFYNLKVEKIKTGRSVSGFLFTWADKKIIDEQVEEIEEVEVSEELMDAIEKAEKNRFIKPFLSEENIIKLLEKFSEDKLIKGLRSAYSLITKEFNSLNYLIKVIEDDVEKPRKKIVLRRIKEAETLKPSLEEIYQKWLKNFNGNNRSEIIGGFVEDISEYGYENDEVALTYYNRLAKLKEGE